jgi:arylsulfatase A-like enzyme
VEDISPHLGCNGESLVSTPHLDQLASEGTLFGNVIMPAPVCSPCRSAMITGVMHTTLGLHNHHSSRTQESAIYLPDSIKTIPELFKQAGYFTFNSGKDDYNFWYDRKKLYEGAYAEHPLYGKSGLKIDWNARNEKNQPFFGQIQLRGGKHIFNPEFSSKVKSRIDRSKVNLPPYYPKDSILIEEWARYLESLQITDDEVHDIIQSLRNDGLHENTLIFFFADHGMRFLRHKQFLYEGGLKVPMIAYWEGNKELITAGSTRNGLVSGLDIGATSLAVAGIDIPNYFEGKNLFSEDYQSSEFVISGRDRCDFTIDRIRSVRTEGFKYIRNFMTDRPAMQPNYRDEWELTKVTRNLFEQGQLNEIQGKYFENERDAEELYDLKNDPYEINNLADDYKYEEILANHRKILESWLIRTNDRGQYLELPEGLNLMLGIWGEQAVNPEYDVLRREHPDLAGSLLDLKNQAFLTVED